MSADLLRSGKPSGVFGSVSLPLGARVRSTAIDLAAQLPCTVDSILTSVALVALAHYSGSGELRVSAPDTAAGTSSQLSITLAEEDSLRTLVSRIEASSPEPRSGEAAAGDRCPVAVAVTSDTAALDLVGPQPDGAPRELALVFELVPGAERITIFYAEDLYEAATAQQLANHVLSCLDALLPDPDPDLGPGRSLLEAMRPDVREALGFLEPLAPSTDPDALYVPGDAVRSWAARTPDATAILAADGTTLSYAGLAALAGGLAQQLAGATAGGEPVGVLTSDSRTAAIAMVACQFAGRCYVMLDPDFPDGRITALVGAAGCGVILVGAESRKRAARVVPPADVVVLHYEQDEYRAEPSGAAEPRPAGPAAAYIAFTSGTTGTPKGVVQPQRSFAQFLAWQQAQLGLGPGSRVAMWSAPIFDACSMEVFGALAYGATLCVPPPGERRNPEAVAAWLSSARVTFFQGVPSFIEYVVAALERTPRPMMALRNVIVAGEVFPPALATRMRSVFPAARLHNMFGPTESVLCSRFEIPADWPGNRRLPVGRPIAGRRLLLLDAGTRPVPRGAVGEICIVGHYLASGYVGDETQTRSRFRPLDDGSGRVIYHTGDYGRIGSDGQLRYLGRRDAQIKVRGIRVNLDEVESVLARDPRVARCKVVDVRVAAGHVQLVAFVQPTAGPDQPVDDYELTGDYELAGPATASAWARAVGDTLGSRVAPTRFILARQIPRTATGKPDLNQMREAAERLRASGPATAGPATAGLTTTGPAVAGQPVGPTGTRDRIRRLARQVAGRPVDDDENLLAAAGDQLLAALRLRKALMTCCPGVFDSVDVRARASVNALVGIAEKADARATAPQAVAERNTSR